MYEHKSQLTILTDATNGTGFTADFRLLACATAASVFKVQEFIRSGQVAATSKQGDY